MTKLSKFFPSAILTIFCLLVFKPIWTEGKLPIPGDALVGLYNPWRDFYADKYPSGIPYSNFLVTDPVRQQYPWRYLSISSLKSGRLPIWNPYAFSGTPLLANWQSAAFYPLNFLYWIFSFNTSWTIQIVLQIILGGTFMYLYLRNLNLQRESAILGMVAWTGSGFFTAWLTLNTMIQTVIWLPLILFSIDKIFSSKKELLWSGLLSFSIVCSLFAGALQPFAYVMVLSSFYFSARLYQTRNWSKIIYIFGSLILALIVTSPQWVATLKYLPLSARNVDLGGWQRNDWFLPWPNLTQFIAPDYFGNPATLNYFGIWNYMEFVGYIGIAPLLLAVVAMLSSRGKKTIFFLSVLVTSLIFALPTPIAKIPYVVQIPFLSTAQPSRFLVLIDFSLAVLSALGLNFLINQKFLLKKILLPFLIVLILLGALWSIAINHHLYVSIRNLYLPTALIIATLMVFLIFKKTKFGHLIPIILIVITVFDLFRFMSKFEPFSDSKYIFPETSAIRFLEEQSKNDIFRVASLDDQILPPNSSIIYRISTIDGYDPLYPKAYGDLIAAIEHSGVNFNRIITPKNYKDSMFNYLGVKYLLTFDDLDPKNYSLVFTEGKTKIYYNPNYYPRAFFVDSPKINSKVNITKYSPGDILLLTSNEKNGSLVLTENYYPDWKATIDDNPTKIYLNNKTFMNIIVPPGKHSVHFQIN